MKQLVMKDMRLIGIMNLVVAGIAAIGGIFGIYLDKAYKSNYAYILIMFVTLFLVNNLLAAKESKTKSDNLMISMPVKKFDLVKARYLTMAIYIFVTLGVMYLISNIGKILFSDMLGNPMGFVEILVISSIMIFILSLYIPIQYYDIRNAQMFFVFLQMFIILSPNLLDRFNIDIESLSFLEKMLTMDFETLGFIVFGGSLVLYLISSFISKGIYEAKQF